VARIDASLTSLIETFVQRQAIVSSDRAGVEDVAPFSDDDPAHQAVRLLLRIDSALLLLSGRQ
jgi:hypothetical protein